MQSLKDIKGQDNAVRFLSRSISSGRLASSYLFAGPRGVGRALTAKVFIKILLCKEREDSFCGICPSCRKVEEGEHPDVLWIKPEKNKSIKIAEVRKIRDILNLKPYEASLSVAVIEDAHTMTSEAQNALLKVLEDTPEESIIILISDKKELLLPTVVSRCSEVRFSLLPIPDAKEIIMKETDLPPEEATFLSYYSQGSPGMAIGLVEEGVAERKEKLISIIGDIAREEYSSLLNWDTENKDTLIEDIDLLVIFFRDIALGKEGMEDLILDKDLVNSEGYTFFKTWNVKELQEVVERLIKIRKALAGNVNPKLVAQALPGAIK